MSSRFVSIWLPHLSTDQQVLTQPALRGMAFILATPVHGRMIVQALSTEAGEVGIEKGMAVADARAIFPSLMVQEHLPELAEKALVELAEWCIRYTPNVAIDPGDGLLLDATGCAYLWGGEREYIRAIVTRIRDLGYHVRAAIADTIGAAWAHAHYGKSVSIIQPGDALHALLPLPPVALRLEPDVLDKMQKLGFYQIRNFIHIPARVLRRRFGKELIRRMEQALGHVQEFIQTIQPVVPYQERLPCLEPIVAAAGIEIALQKLLENLCARLNREGKGLRSAILKCYRVDGQTRQIDIVTNRASRHVNHLFRLLELKIKTIAPGFGIELFVLEAPEVEDIAITQEAIWDKTGGFGNAAISELLDTLTGRVGQEIIQRYLPDEHHWPERSVKKVASLVEKPLIPWRTDRPRPVYLLPEPEIIDVTALVPDYPPASFRYKGRVHYIERADGPERIEQEWWLEH